MDVELVPIAEHTPTFVRGAWRATLRRMGESRTLHLSANDDPYAPLNSGLLLIFFPPFSILITNGRQGAWAQRASLLLIRPSAALYAEGLAVLRDCRFNYTHGWELSGVTPAAVVPKHINWWAFPQVARVHGKPEPWEFGQSQCDQDLLLYLCFIRHRVGKLRDAHATVRPLSRHWWSANKPWLRLLDPGYVSPTREPLRLAELYDYLLREQPAEQEGADVRQVGGIVPPLLAAQRAVRRAIENHPRFADVVDIWQQHSWVQQGYAYHVPLPTIPAARAGGQDRLPPVS